MKIDFGWEPPNFHPIGWSDLVLGWERTWDMPITFESVAWYADLAEDPNPWYGKKGSPWGPPVAPPLLVSRFCFRVCEPLGISVGWINTWNDSETIAPVLVGTVARFHGRITDKFEWNGRRYVRYAIDVSDAATGKPLQHEEKEFIVEKISAGDANADRAPDHRTAPRRPEGAQSVEGRELPGFEHTVTRMIVRSRQWHGTNPVHSDPDVAARQGFRRPPATGQISAAYVQRMCVEFFGEHLFSHSRLKVLFRKPVHEDDRLTIGGRVVDERPCDGGQKVIAECWCRNAEGEDVTRVGVEVLVPSGTTARGSSKKPD
jgi:acyl dehydratase